MNKPNGADWNAIFEQLRRTIEGVRDSLHDMRQSLREQRESIDGLYRIATTQHQSIVKLVEGIASHEARILRLEEGRGGKAQ